MPYEAIGEVVRLATQAQALMERGDNLWEWCPRDNGTEMPARSRITHYEVRIAANRGHEHSRITLYVTSIGIRRQLEDLSMYYTCEDDALDAREKWLNEEIGRGRLPGPDGGPTR